jgi:hypothetical protein
MNSQCYDHHTTTYQCVQSRPIEPSDEYPNGADNCLNEHIDRYFWSGNKGRTDRKQHESDRKYDNTVESKQKSSVHLQRNKLWSERQGCYYRQAVSFDVTKDIKTYQKLQLKKTSSCKDMNQILSWHLRC